MDTGASVSLITSDLCSKLALRPVNREKDETLFLVDGTELVTEKMVMADVELGSCVTTSAFLVVPWLPAPVHLGMDFVKKVNLVLDFHEGSIHTGGSREGNVRFHFLGMSSASEVDDGYVDDEGRPSFSCPSSPVPISAEDQVRLEELFNEFHAVFSDVPGHTDMAQHVIEVGDAAPIRSHPYRMGPERKRALDKELAMLLDTGKVEPSTSPWASPVVMVHTKKNGQYRMCIGYRKLNAMTRVDAFPTPTVDAILASLHGAQIFSSLDLRSRYWQMSVAQEDGENTAFVCEQGLFQFRVLPFGVVNGPTSFQRLMSEVLGDLIGHNCYVYMDDIVCYSTSFSQHLIDLREILLRLQAAGLTVNAEKCQSCREMQYLGHVICADGLKPDPGKVSAIDDYPTPKNLKEFERFLGMVGWYQKFIPHFSDLAAPLLQLKKKGMRWEWNDDCASAFDMLKETDGACAGLSR